MRKILGGFLLISLLSTACTPWFLEQAEIVEERDNLEVFVSEDEPILATIAGRDISIVLDPNQELDTNEVVVTLVNLGSAYLVETADPSGRYLPSVQLVLRQDEPLQQITMPQIQVSAGWTLRFVNNINLQYLRERFHETIPLDQLKSFLARKIYGRGINIIFKVPQSIDDFQEVNVYSTPGTMTFLVVGRYDEGGGGGSLLSQVQVADLKLVAVSLLADSLETLEPNFIIEKAQTMQGGIYVAYAESTLPLPNTGMDEEATPLPECADNEVLTFREEEGVKIAECQAAPWLDQTPVPSATIEPTPTGPTPTPTLPPPTPTPTPPPVIYTDTFPAVDPQILGDCPSWVHDWYNVTGPDGNTYRTWHPVTVRLEPSNPNSPTCSFAHEHGDPPHPQGPQPTFGYVAFHAGKVELIKEHEGYKVFTHIHGQLTGWSTEEQIIVNPDIDIQFWFHQGSWSRSRLTERYHDVGFWSLDAGGRQTEVYYFADTGELTDKCGSQNTSGPKRAVASECDYGNEIWDFGGDIAGIWDTPVQVAVLNPMNFMRGNPNFLQSIELISTSDEICGVNFFSCEYKLPFGHANSLWLGNMRMLYNPSLQWSNAGGAETTCTDVYGKRAADGFCTSQTRGYILQKVATINFYGGSSGVWDSSYDALGEALGLPQGAPGGN
ncbi:MAG: hypothetical protein A2Z14_04395 [Chloroflexi bacterium RBG_16_48_8]|nr:MAG: hypothetical protein A2Z14_04395 [Chloroflexi bacterium RBG_16_48_8]